MSQPVSGAPPDGSRARRKSLMETVSYRALTRQPQAAGRGPTGRLLSLPAMLLHLLLHIAVLTGTILLLARLLPSVRVKSVGTAIFVAIVFSVLNVLLGWFIRAVLFVPALFTL